MELDGNFAGYLRKVEVGKVKGDVLAHNLGGSLRQKKHVAKMSWDTIKFEVGVGMGADLYKWIQSSFREQHTVKSGAVMVCNQNYEVQRRVDFEEAHITEITLPRLAAKDGKELYFSVTIQPTRVRHTAGDGSKNQIKIAAEQKLYAGTNFRLLTPSGPTQGCLMSIDSLKWTQKVEEFAVGEFLESTYVPTSVEVGDVKLTLSAHKYQEWEAKAKSWFVDGARTEALEVTKTIQILGPDGNDVVAEITLENCGYKELSFSAMEANKSSVASFDAVFYCEGYDFVHKKYG